MAFYERYAVIVGETGSGKSTFINYVANYFNKGTLQRPQIAIPTTYRTANMNYVHNENVIEDRTKSKTIDCQCYSFELNGILFHFIDTPGVNDTGGLTQDSQNVDKVFSYIEKLPELAALILILNGAVARITINIKNVLATYRDRLPNAIYSNTIIILTNCEEHTVNFSPTSVDLPERCSVFHMQNSAFSSNPKTWNQGTAHVLQRHFDLSMKTMDRIINKVLSLQPVSTKLFKDMSDDRNQIKQKLHNARMTIFDLQNLEDELAAFELSADIHAANAEKFRNFSKEKRIPCNQRIKTDYYNMICMECEMVCQEKCDIREEHARDFNFSFQSLTINQNGRCNKCPNHCAISMHFRAKHIIQKFTNTVSEVVESMRQRYLQAKSGQKAADLKCNDLQSSKIFLESALQQQYKEVKESVRNLQETCKEANVTAILFQFIELLERDASNLKSHSVIQKSRTFINNLKQLCSIPEQSSDTQISIWSPPSDKNMERKLNQRTTVRKDEDPSANDATQVQDLSRRSVMNEISSSGTLYPTLQTPSRLQSIGKYGHDDNTNVFHDLHTNHELTTNNQEAVNPSNDLKRSEKLQSSQDIPDEQLNIKCERKRENIAMLTVEELIHLSNNNVTDQTYDEIKTELQSRCSGESTGFLTLSEQLVLCEEYAKYQHMKFKDLLRLSLKLNEEIEQITGGDPFKINLISLEKRLQLSAINLRIKKKG